MRLRGDGIQAKFIPEMLDFLDSKQKAKKYFIWGFEEPENSAEYKNQQELAKKFKEIFSNNKQIFLTTHSEEFLSIYDSQKVDKDKRRANLYHVRKTNNKYFKDFSVIDLFDVEKQSFDFATVKSELENDIGSSLIRATYSKELKNKEDEFLELKKNLELKKLSLEEDLKRQKNAFSKNFPKQIFICEDENAIEIWHCFFKKYGIEKVHVIASKGCTVKNIEIWISENIKGNTNYKPKVLRSLDRDGYTKEQISFLEKILTEKNGYLLGINSYQVKFLPVYELENFAICSDCFFTDEILKQNLHSLEDSFCQTAGEHIKQNDGKFSKNTDLFRFNEIVVISNRMKREAEKDIKKYFPGKEMKKLKHNFNEKKFLIDLNLTNYPLELKRYLSEIKTFFEK